ncbi:MAG: response regulator, partial [Bryobacteraceae bacterium]
MKVLVAEDNATSRAVLRSALLRWGYEVVLAENGAQAWEILAQPDPPVMAILDWMMPHMTGPEVCRH